MDCSDQQGNNGKESKEGSASSIHQGGCQSASCALKGANTSRQNQQADEAFGRFNPPESAQARDRDWSSAVAARRLPRELSSFRGKDVCTPRSPALRFPSAAVG